MGAFDMSQLHTLHRTTGSAHHFSATLDQEIICAVNAPVDVQRRDELPNDSYVDVHVRPNTGVGMIRERHLESLIQSVVTAAILSRLWPRTAVQITLQILKDESTAALKSPAGNYLTVLPALLDATCLALIDAGVPMRCTFVSTVVQVDKVGNIATQTDSKKIAKARSLHVFTFSSEGDLLLIESEGAFTLSEFSTLVEMARKTCLGSQSDSQMAVDGEDYATGGLFDGLRETVTKKVISNNRWRDG